MQNDENKKTEKLNLELQEVKKLNPAKVFKSKFGKNIMHHYDKLDTMDRTKKESMNRKEIFLSFDDLVSLDMTEENAAEAIFFMKSLQWMKTEIL